MQVTSYKLQVKRSNVQQRSKGTHAEEIRVKGQNTKAKSQESKVKRQINKPDELFFIISYKLRSDFHCQHNSLLVC